MFIGRKRDLHLSFELHNCRGWQRREDLFAAIRLAVSGDYIARIIGDGHQLGAYGRDVLAGHIKRIHWYNYLGPHFSVYTGRNVWLNAPGWKAQEWAGGICYQVTEEFRAFGLEERLSINAHFSNSGLSAADFYDYIG